MFVYMPVQLYSQKVVALVDSGSNISIMSEALSNSLPSSLVYQYDSCKENLVVADSYQVQIQGVARVKVATPYGKYTVNIRSLCK